MTEPTPFLPASRPEAPHGALSAARKADAFRAASKAPATVRAYASGVARRPFGRRSPARAIPRGSQLGRYFTLMIPWTRGSTSRFFCRAFATRSSGHLKQRESVSPELVFPLRRRHRST